MPKAQCREEAFRGVDTGWGIGFGGCSSVGQNVTQRYISRTFSHAEEIYWFSNSWSDFAHSQKRERNLQLFLAIWRAKREETWKIGNNIAGFDHILTRTMNLERNQNSHQVSHPSKNCTEIYPRHTFLHTFLSLPKTISPPSACRIKTSSGQIDASGRWICYFIGWLLYYSILNIQDYIQY